MEIRYGSKEENNKMRQEEFLKLSGVERIYCFLKLSSMPLPTMGVKKNKKNNFYIIKR